MKDKEALEKVQCRATKCVRGMKNKTYQQRLQQLGLTTLKTRRIRGDLIETFKILTGKGVDSETFFQFARFVQSKVRAVGLRSRLELKNAQKDVEETPQMFQLTARRAVPCDSRANSCFI